MTTNKSYLENSFQEGGYKLRCYLDGVDDIGELLVSNEVVSVLHPKGQTLSGTWSFLMCLKSGEILKFYSKCTEIGGWQEMGSLAISLIKTFDKTLFSELSLEGFVIAKVSFLVYQSENVYSEAGIKLQDPDLNEIVVLSSIAPGSVSVKAPFYSGKFEPELDFEDYSELNAT